MTTTHPSIASTSLGEEMTFVQTADQTNGELLEIEARYDANQSWETMLMHYHPQQDETFEIVEGMMTVSINGVTRTYVAGERFEVPRNTVHGMRNLGSVPVRVRWYVRPALQTQEFFETILPLADTGELFDPARIGQLTQTFGHVFRLAERP